MQWWILEMDGSEHSIGRMPMKIPGGVASALTALVEGDTLEDACREYIRRCEAKRRKPFNIGDYVRAIMPRSTEERNRGPMWTRQMDVYDREIGVVHAAREDGVITVFFGPRNYDFLPEWLEKVTVIPA